MKRNGFLTAIGIIAVTFLTALVLSSCFWLTGTDKDKDKDGDDDFDTPKVYDLSELDADHVDAKNYDGTEQRIKITLRKGERFVTVIDPDNPHDDLVTEYSNNVNVGEATVKIKAKSGSEKFRGEKQISFTVIRALATGTKEFAELKEFLSSGNYSSVTLLADVEIPQGETLIIEKETKLTLGDYNLVSNGKIVNDGTISTFGTQYGKRGRLILNGETVLTGQIELYDGAEIIVNGDFTNDGDIKLIGTSATVYGNKEFNGSGTVDENINLYVRVSLTLAEVKLSYLSAEYTGKELKPTVTVVVDGKEVSGSEYDVEYSDNVNVGEATVSITAKENSANVAGERKLTFNIDRGEITVNIERDLKAALENKNYRTVKADCGLYDFTVPEDFTVITFFEVKGDIVVNGTLVARGVPEYDGILSAAQLRGRIINNGKVIFDGVAVVHNELSGGGEYVNSGKLFLEPTATIADGTNVVNKNKAFANAPVSGLNSVEGGFLTVRERITDENVSLSATEYVYDGKSKHPNCVFSEDVDHSSYVTYYCYEDEGEYLLFPQNAGKLLAKVVFNEISETYFGETTLRFEIKPGETSAQNAYDFKTKFESGNYCKFTIEFAIVFNENFTLESGIEIIIAEGSSASSAKRFTVKGKFVNNGSFYDASGETWMIQIVRGGEMINNGKAYFNGAPPDGVTNNGTVYERKSLSKAKWLNFPTQVVYGEASLRPAVNLELDGTPLVSEVDYHSPVYVDGNEALEVRAKVFASSYSELVYGETDRTFTIIAGSIEVDSFDDLSYALSKVKKGPDGTVACYYKDIYVTVGKIEVTSTKRELITVTIPENVTLHLGSCVMYFYKNRTIIDKPDPTGQGYKIVNNGKIVSNREHCFYYDVKLEGNPVEREENS